MSKNAKLALEAALSRIIAAEPKRIPVSRKLSVRAVEEEANLGNGSGYYYPEVVEKIKRAKAKMTGKAALSSNSDTERLRAKAKQETRIKEKYKQEKLELKAMVASMAAEHHHLNDALRKSLLEVNNLESKNEEQRKQIVELKRSKITGI